MENFYIINAPLFEAIMPSVVYICLSPGTHMCSEDPNLGICLQPWHFTLLQISQDIMASFSAAT